MKGTQGITADVNIYFINYKMIKTPVIKTNWSYSLNQNHFHWMNACHIWLPYLQLYRGCIILRRVRLFLIFSLNYQQGVTVVFVSTKLQDYNINFTNKLKVNLWIHLNLTEVHHLKGLTSPYVVSYLHFLNLNSSIILLLSPNFCRHWGWVWRDLCLLCFLPARFRCMRVSLRNQNKCKLSIATIRVIPKTSLQNFMRKMLMNPKK